MKMYDRSEKVCERGRELLLLRVRVRSDGSPLPAPLEEFYDELSERCFSSALATLGERVLREHGSARLNALIETELRRFGSAGEYVCALRDIRVSQGGICLFRRRESEIWECGRRGEILLGKREVIRRFLPKKTKKDIKRAILSPRGGVIFEGEEIFMFHNSSSNAPIIQKIEKKEQIVKMQ